MGRSLTWASASSLREWVAKGEVSPVEIVQNCLERIERLNPRLRAFITVDADGAMAAARRAEAEVRSAGRLGPLHGIPVAIKDDVWAQGMPATSGSLIFARFVPSRDGTVVRRLRAAGAIIIGKTNLPEFASWPRTRSLVGGETLNPWDQTRIPGASSGGSAAAVASGMVPLAIGTDGGGSVRIPSALCGLVGLLPTIGRVPDHGGFLCSPVSSAGPMARSVEDLVLLQQVIAGPDPNVRCALTEEPPDLAPALDGTVAGLRIAWSPDFGWIPVDPSVVDAAGAALQALAAAGAQVSAIGDRIPHPWGDGRPMAAVFEAAAIVGEDAVPDGSAPHTAFAECALVDSTARCEGFFAAPEIVGLLKSHHHLLSAPHRLIASIGMADVTLPGPEELQAAMDRVFASHDVLCSPTMAMAAPLIPPGWGSPYPDSYSGTNFTFIANATGCPAATVPCGTVDGLPVGLQIIGRPRDELTVLRVARAVEAAMPPMPWRSEGS